MVRLVKNKTFERYRIYAASLGYELLNVSYSDSNRNLTLDLKCKKGHSFKAFQPNICDKSRSKCEFCPTCRRLKSI